MYVLTSERYFEIQQADLLKMYTTDSNIKGVNDIAVIHTYVFSALLSYE
jgi:hypothetical protein